MPRFDKWLTNIPPEAPVSRIARRAIGGRLRAVAHYVAQLGQIKKPAKDDVHQLRIWTRRAAAALRLFDPLVPGKRGGALKRKLRKLRRAAGCVRDCDVFLDQLRVRGDQSPRLIKNLKAQRRKARRALQARCRRLQRRSRFERDNERLLILEWPKRNSGRKSPPFAGWCRDQLSIPADQFFELAAAGLDNEDDLHALRIAGKRLRYALELSAVAIPVRPHQRLYAVLSDLQERLGAVCDHLAAFERLQRWHKKPKVAERSVLDRALQQEGRRLAASRRQFLRWWTPTRRNRLQMLWKAAVAAAQRSG